jgi:hypothetical protein
MEFSRKSLTYERSTPWYDRTSTEGSAVGAPPVPDRIPKSTKAIPEIMMTPAAVRRSCPEFISRFLGAGSD